MKNRSHRAAARSGMVCITSASSSCEGALLGGGALSGVPLVGGVNLGREPSAGPCVLSGCEVSRFGRCPVSHDEAGLFERRHQRSSVPASSGTLERVHDI
jgi:hypothetical protein